LQSSLHCLAFLASSALQPHGSALRAPNQDNHVALEAGVNLLSSAKKILRGVMVL
jgi:hypothetical protein